MIEAVLRPSPFPAWSRLAHSLAIAVLALLAACGGRQELWSDSAPADLVPVFQQVSPADLNAVVATRSGAVVAVGDNGVILRSADGGQHRSPVAGTAGKRRLHHLVSAPDGTLVAVGEAGAIVRSRDDGLAWSEIQSTGTSQTLRRVLALSAQVLVAVGEQASIVRSADGGDSWSPVHGNDGTGLWDVATSDGRHLVAVGDAGVMLHSDNGGVGWTMLERGVASFRAVMATRRGALVAVGEGIMRAASGSAVWSPANTARTSPDPYDRMPFTHVVETPAGTLVALSVGRPAQFSVDDGANWTPAATGSSIAGEDLVLVAQDGTLAAVGLAQAMRSTDGGAGWTRASAPKAGSGLNSAVALPGGTLLAVGRTGTILRSADNGDSWASVAAAGKSERLHAVAAGVNRVLVAVGETGAIMRSTNDGQSWVDGAKVNAALMTDPRIEASQIDFIDRFEQNGLLSRRTVGTHSNVEYLLDPLAECLAAHVHARGCGDSRERWDALLRRVTERGERAQGFMVALRMNHEAYAADLGFPPLVFPALGETNEPGPPVHEVAG